MPFHNARKKHMDILYRYKMSRELENQFLREHLGTEYVDADVRQLARENAEKFANKIYNYRETCIKQLYRRAYILQRQAQECLDAAEHIDASKLLGSCGHELGYEPFFTEVSYTPAEKSDQSQEYSLLEDSSASPVPLPREKAPRLRGECISRCIPATEQETQHFRRFLQICAKTEPKSIRNLLNHYSLCSKIAHYKG